MDLRWIFRADNADRKRRFPIKLALTAGSCVAAFSLFSSPAEAGVSEIPSGFRVVIDELINGASPGDNGSPPWLTTEITNFSVNDPVYSNGVSILFSPNLVAGEFITKTGFNLTDEFQNDPLNSNPFGNLVVKCIELSPNSSICDPKNYATQATLNSYSIEGTAVSGFDLGFDFKGTGRDGGSGRLSGTKQVRFNLTRTKLTAEDLLGYIFVKALKNDVNVAAKVQGISKGGSGVIGDPPGTAVPGPLPVLGAAAAFQASRRLRRRLRPTAAAAPRLA